MRGKGSDEVTLTVPARITPAYAGKSTQLQFHYAIIRDHPRLCGEKDIVHAVSKCNIGSPPPMRGKVVHGSMLRTTSRITPAYAGKSGQSTYKNYECGDHPRLCGEKGIQKCRCWYGRGSPPPMRGKAALPAVPLLRSGITPAYAGKSLIHGGR